MKNYALFGRAVAARRKSMGMTQVQVAQHAQIGHATLSDIESSTHLPRIDTADMIAQALNTTVDDLLTCRGIKIVPECRIVPG